MNSVNLVGNVVADPELTTTQNNSNLSRVRIAVKKNYPSANGEYESDFISVMTFGKTAEYSARYIKKGDLVGIKGRIDVIKRKDSEYTELSISVENIEILRRSQPSQPTQEDVNGMKKENNQEEIDVSVRMPDEEDLPF